MLFCTDKKTRFDCLKSASFFCTKYYNFGNIFCFPLRGLTVCSKIYISLLILAKKNKREKIHTSILLLDLIWLELSNIFLHVPPYSSIILHILPFRHSSIPPFLSSDSKSDSSFLNLAKTFHIMFF